MPNGHFVAPYSTLMVEDAPQRKYALRELFREVIKKYLRCFSVYSLTLRSQSMVAVPKQATLMFCSSRKALASAA